MIGLLPNFNYLVAIISHQELAHMEKVSAIFQGNSKGVSSQCQRVFQESSVKNISLTFIQNILN